jgi:hypothetical protein
MFTPNRYFFLSIVISLGVALSACAPAGLTPEQVQATANDIAATSVVLTLTALPTNTVAPTATPLPSATPSPMDTATSEPSATATTEPIFIATSTPYGQLDPTQFTTAQADKNDKNAPLLMENHTDEEVTIVITSPIYQEYTIKKTMIIILDENTYTYQVTVGNKTLVGSFSITNGDKHVFSVYADKVHFSTP